MFTGKLETIGGRMKYNIYEFIGFEKWDQKILKRIWSFMEQKKCLHFYPHEIPQVNWKFYEVNKIVLNHEIKNWYLDAKYYFGINESQDYKGNIWI